MRPTRGGDGASGAPSADSSTSLPAPQPLGQRIRADLEGKILSGAWPPGHRIPFEHELMAQYGCARMTVNKVIAGLVAAGLVERRRRAGSFVAQPRIHSAVLRIPDIPAEIAARGETYGYRLISRKRRTAEAAEPPGLDGQEVLDLSCLHLANGRPLALEARLISLAAVPEAADADFAATPPGSWLLRHVPWTEAEHRISAVGASAREAEALGLAKGAACLSLERRTWRAGDTVTYVRQLFRGDVYDLVARFAP
ncbi:histidine utilization repressor [Ancylobacter radicis]|uniref:Histidine utilization repressor n=1 Tax=Ancylobacter radicis TaxID=2836179 RepID=A0ABS5R2A7_9HYPH|nr:histidine utilization repressor [Ancylobacter radicis]MBS9475751.1 histidine utilization repressor [Ancylobacter radicis]